MGDKSLKNTLPYDTGYGGGSTKDGQATGEHNTSRAEGARQERLNFDADTGKLVVHDEDQQIESWRSAATERPVLDKMAAEGFFFH